MVNCLFKRRVTKIGQGIRTTPLPITYEWGVEEQVVVLNAAGSPIPFERGHPVNLSLEEFQANVEGLNRRPAEELDPMLRPVAVRILLPDERLRQIVLVDTPGIDFTTEDTHLAETSAASADFVLFVTENKQLADWELRFVRQLTNKQIPCAVLFNCWGSDPDKWSPDGWLNQDNVANWCAGLDGLLHYRVNGQNLFNFVFWSAAEKVAGNNLQESEGWGRKLRVFFEAAEGRGTPADEELLEKSGGNDIARFVFAEPERCLGWNAGCLGILHREIREWQCAGKQLIKILNQGS